MRYSIKTLDGNRNEFEHRKPLDLNEFYNGRICFVGFPVDGGVKYFNIFNIVSITEYEEEDENK